MYSANPDCQTRGWEIRKGPDRAGPSILCSIPAAVGSGGTRSAASFVATNAASGPPQGQFMNCPYTANRPCLTTIILRVTAWCPADKNGRSRQSTGPTLFHSCPSNAVHAGSAQARPFCRKTVGATHASPLPSDPDRTCPATSSSHPPSRVSGTSCAADDATSPPAASSGTSRKSP